MYLLHNGFLSGTYFYAIMLCKYASFVDDLLLEQRCQCRVDLTS